MIKSPEEALSQRKPKRRADKIFNSYCICFIKTDLIIVYIVVNINLNITCISCFVYCLLRKKT